MNMEESQELSLFEMELDSTAEGHLGVISKWGKFISIAGFAMVALVLAVLLTKGRPLLDFFLTFIVPNGDARIWTLLILLCLAIVSGLLWLVLLLRLSMQLAGAMRTSSTAGLTDAFKSLHQFFIVTAISAGLSVAFIIYSLVITP